MERVCVRDRESLKTEVALVVKMAIGETISCTFPTLALQTIFRLQPLLR
jgi:hypothetical protein